MGNLIFFCHEQNINSELEEFNPRPLTLPSSNRKISGFSGWVYRVQILPPSPSSCKICGFFSSCVTQKFLPPLDHTIHQNMKYSISTYLPILLNLFSLQLGKGFFFFFFSVELGLHPPIINSRIPPKAYSELKPFLSSFKILSMVLKKVCLKSGV